MDILALLGFLVTLAGFLIVFSNNISKFSNAVTRLNTTVENLQEMMKELKEDNSSGHRRMWKHNEEQDEKINDHEIRINNLENK